jgi:hypothetical protein
MPQWRWRTFPVFFAFVIGLLVASMINGAPNNEFAAIVQILALLGVGYGLAHLFVTNIIVAGRVRRREQAIARGELPEEDEWVDEVVHPDEERPAP